jgi:hypothetical protein
MELRSACPISNMYKLIKECCVYGKIAEEFLSKSVMFLINTYFNMLLRDATTIDFNIKAKIAHNKVPSICKVEIIEKERAVEL